ncbi:MAG: undecaprenyl/decaprenyl-phosphate alpha-N-acetylglucosaminyl 1-phosphate transferase [Armatimonadetes bacterium]|nr:undecaprenyl/decaprenyl-phosphate alpha-N-acetylglucosaminyl 1-phosphate transferase [Armatimonadota bacterium]
MDLDRLFLMKDLAISFFVTAIFTALVRFTALKLGWIHRLNPRDERISGPHFRTVAMGGGLGIFMGIVTTAIMIEHDHVLRTVLGLATIALLLGLYDDLKNCRPLAKSIVQTLLGVVTLFFGIKVQGLPIWLSIPITVLGIVGLMNAVNILDNMDGIVNGLMIIAMLGYAGIGIATQNNSVTSLSLIIAGACLGFWIYNKPPASIFMGDAGSMLLGYLLAVVGILATFGNYPNLVGQLGAPLLIAGIFIANTTFVTLWRKTHGLPITFWCLEHSLNYRLIAFVGKSAWRVNLFFYIAQTFISTLALISIFAPLLLSLLLLLIGITGLFWASWRLWQVTPESVAR